MFQTSEQSGILDIRISDDVIEKLEKIKSLLSDIQGLKQQNEAPKKVLRIDDVAKRYNVCRNTAASIFIAEDSPGYKIGQQWFIEEDEMLEYLKQKTAKS